MIRYGNYLDSLIGEKDEQYVLGLSIRGDLLNCYNYDINSMDRMAKKLAKKHKKNPYYKD